MISSPPSPTKVKLKIFPYILIRVAGLSFDLVESLSDSGLVSEGLDKAGFQDEKALIRYRLQKLASLPELQHGLLLSSHSFQRRLRDYLHKEKLSFHKKERQTELKLLEYLSRAATKTSPFSYFTSLDLKMLDSAIPAGNSEKQSFPEVNNRVFGELRELLKGYLPLFRQLPVVINPTLDFGAGELIFLHNENNLEEIQQLDAADPSVNLILQALQNHNGKAVFSDFACYIDELTNWGIPEITRYLYQLIQLGLINWEWQPVGGQLHWPVAFQRWCEEWKPFTLRSSIAACIENLVKLPVSYRSASPEKRLDLLNQAFLQWRQLAAQLQKEGRFNAGDSASKLPNPAYRSTLRVEQLLYENTTWDVPVSLHSEEIRPLLTILNRFLKLTTCLYFNPLKEEIAKCFKQHFSSAGTVDFLEFYRFFQQSRPWELKKEKFLYQQLLQQYTAELRALVPNNRDVVDLDVEALNSIFSQQPSEPPPYSALIQLIRSGNQYTAVLNAATAGYGKLFGRFLPIFSVSATEALRHWNARHHQGYLLAEIKDASLSNANLHPPVLEYELITPGGEAAVSAEKVLTLNDLQLVAGQPYPLLQSRTHQKSIKAIDLGLEAPEYRAPVFQTLSTFADPGLDIQALLNVINKVAARRVGECCLMPRIVINKKLIVQRKRWIFRASGLPTRNSEKQSFVFAEAIKRWREKWDIPLQVFIRIHQGAKDGLEFGKTGKPQYINFQNPLFHDLFAKAVRSSHTFLSIEEMLPDAEQLSVVHGKKFVMEFAVQFRG